MKTTKNEYVNMDVNLEEAVVQYVTGPNPEMIGQMVGRDRIKGEPVIMAGLDLCIQKTEHMRDTVPENSPDDRVPPRSARAIMTEGFGETFELYLVCPNPKGQSPGTLWYLTAREFDLARDWELVDYGAQEDIKTVAITDKGVFRQVIVHGLQHPPFAIDRVVTNDSFVDFSGPEDKMLQRANETREEFLKRIADSTETTL